MNFNPHDYQDYAIRYIEKHPVAAVLLGLHRPIAKKQIGVVGRGIPAQSAPVSAHAGRTRSDCRATPVSQNQVRQCEQHIQFGGLFSQTSVSRFSIPELPLNDRKYMFYLCPNR